MGMLKTYAVVIEDPRADEVATGPGEHAGRRVLLCDLQV
jgi:hypothetical protein